MSEDTGDEGTPPGPLAEKDARTRERRFQQIEEWAEYVRTHPDDDWGPSSTGW